VTGFELLEGHAERRDRRVNTGDGVGRSGQERPSVRNSATQAQPKSCQTQGDMIDPPYSCCYSLGGGGTPQNYGT